MPDQFGARSRARGNRDRRTNPAGVREPEGPFGEFPQYYGPRANREVIEVDAITHRAQPIFHTIVGGGYEHLILGGVPREAMLLQHLRRSFPNVLDVRLTRGGTCRYHLAIKMDKTNDGEPKNVMMSAFGAHYDIKQVVVVDKDVDISMSEEIEWAVATRFQADRDLWSCVARSGQNSIRRRTTASARRWASTRRRPSMRPSSRPSGYA